VLYGCALHAAGRLMQRGIRLLGWIFIASGCGLFVVTGLAIPSAWYGHAVMGLFFGLLQQVYGVYLYLTEKKETTA
jgi:hypothetical protein